jgi:hypothetical protein
VTVFFEVTPFASDALLTTLHSLLKNVLQTVDRGWKSPEIAWSGIWTVWRMLKWSSTDPLFPSRAQINSDLAPCDFRTIPTMNRDSEARNFEVIDGLQHVFEKWVERRKKNIACQARYFEKETVTAPLQRSDSE